MSWLQKLQKKPQKEKIKIIWISVVCFGAFMIILWVLTSRIPQIKERDTTLFRIIGRGAKDVGDNFKKPVPANP